MRDRSAARVGRILLAVLVLLAAAGCARQRVIAGVGHPNGHASSSAGPIRTVWQRTDLHVVGGPVEAAGRLIVLVDVADTALQLQGLDPATGATVWTQPYSLSDATPGVTPGVSVIGDRVIQLLPGPDPGGELVSVAGLDAATGAQAWALPAGYVYSAPTACGTQSDHFCLTYQDQQQYLASALTVLDPSTGRVTATYPSVLRELGGGMYDAVGDSPSSLWHIDVDSGKTWIQPVSALFGPGYSSDEGWYFDSRGDTVLATLGSAGGGSTGYQFGHDQVVAFDSTAGRPKWTLPGSYHCSLGVPGTATFLCQQAGSLQYGEGGADPTYSADFTVTLQGFDPATGVVTWTVPLGRSGTFMGQDRVEVAGPNTIGVDDPGQGFVVLSLSTGHIQRPSPTQVFWCQRENPYRLRTANAYGNLREGGSYSRPCDAAGATSARLPTDHDDIGITSGKLFIWSDPGGLRAVAT